MVQLLDRPEAIPILAPLLIRELSYWLLVGPMGGRIVGMTLGHDRWDQITRTIGRLREQFTEPLRIVDLAAEAGLSPSAFHRQFKAVTSMTPIQYQKQLRLLEARRMILTQRTKVESAAYATGYEPFAVQPGVRAHVWAVAEAGCEYWDCGVGVMVWQKHEAK